MDNAIEKFVDKIAGAGNQSPGDYTDAEGYLVCGKCHTRKQCDVTILGEHRRVPCTCRCREDELHVEEEKRQHGTIVKCIRDAGISNTAYLGCTFSGDDGRDAKVGTLCRKYVSQWDEAYKNNIGMLFYGDVGTGKSYLACAVGNALIEKHISVCITSVPYLIDELSRFGKDRQESIKRLQRFSLLVLDDFGAERGTDYELEQVYSVIDTRAGCKKPTIITTNIPLQTLQNPTDLTHRRIYDRVLEMCPVRVKMAGESRRGVNAGIREQIARQIFTEG